MTLRMLSSLGTGAIQSSTTSCVGIALHNSPSGNLFWPGYCVPNCSFLSLARLTNLAPGHPFYFHEPLQSGMLALLQKSYVLHIIHLSTFTSFTSFTFSGRWSVLTMILTPDIFVFLLHTFTGSGFKLPAQSAHSAENNFQATKSCQSLPS